MRGAMRPARRLRHGVVLAGVLGGLTGCAGDEPVAAAAAGTSRPAADVQASVAIAATNTLWRDADPAKHPKGSCSGCHGADWFDLARAGSSDADLVRRAMIDGATRPQAETLVEAVRAYRARYRMPPAEARSFRPFQPGGTPLPGANAPERDVAFAEQLETLLPTLMTERPIRDLADARRAQAEMADLVLGTNAAGANPRRLDLRRLPVGVVYPLWSQDIAHNPGSMNDWLGDVARDVRPEFATEWHALLDAYLARPDNETFWAMYGAVDRMLRPIDSTITVRSFLDAKFKSALIGQHLLRMEQLGRLDEFARPGGIAFAYLDDPAMRRLANLGTHKELPAVLWDVADRARSTFGGRGMPGFAVENLAEALRLGGAPSFVTASVDQGMRWRDEEQAIRLAWFWLGWTFEPTLQRSGPSNSTRSGEYSKQSLHRAGMLVHMAFHEVARAVAERVIPAAGFDPRTGVTTAAPVWRLENDLWAYGHWRLPSPRDIPASDAVRARQRTLHSRFLGNWFRMQAYLHLDAAAGAPIPQVERIGDQVSHLRQFLTEQQPATLAADLELLRRVLATAGINSP